MNEKLWTIYALVDPTTDEIRYAGATTNLRHRLNQHRNQRHTPKVLLKSDWFRGIESRGLKVGVKIFCQSNAESWESDERSVIAMLRSLGYPLFNVAAGGHSSTGVKMTADQIDNLRAARNTPEAIAKHRALMTPERIAKMSAASKTPAALANYRATHNTPEFKAKRRALMTPEHKAKLRAACKTPEARANHRASMIASHARRRAEKQQHQLAA